MWIPEIFEPWVYRALDRRRFRLVASACLTAVVASAAVCLFSWPRWYERYLPNLQVYLFCVQGCAIFGMLAVSRVRPKAGREERFRRVAVLVLAQLVIYALFWASLGVEEILGVPMTTGAAFTTRLNRIALLVWPVPAAALLAGPLFVPALLRNADGAWGVVALELAGAVIAGVHVAGM